MNKSCELTEKYLSGGKMHSSTKVYQVLQHYKSAENMEEKINISTAISVLAIAYIIDDPTLASKALALAKQRKG